MINLRGIQKSFPNQTHPVLQNIDLTIIAGAVTALIGPSGSGKSTLLRSINLLETPEQGVLQLGEERVEFNAARALSSAQIRRVRLKTGMVFQNFQLFPHLTVLGNVMESLITVHRWSHDKAKERSLALLEKVGLQHKAEAWPSTLSGGQQQRVAIARALAPSPEVLLCDEPTSALDPELALEVVEVLRKLAQEGVTMLIATHDLRLAAALAKQVVFLEDGKIIESGSAQQIFSSAEQARTREYVSSLNTSAPIFDGLPELSGN
jgi:cystine transport system ATP-binding protein